LNPRPKILPSRIYMLSSGLWFSRRELRRSLDILVPACLVLVFRQTGAAG